MPTDRAQIASHGQHATSLKRICKMYVRFGCRPDRRGNIGPFARPEHPAATHGGWTKHQPEPGYFVHRSPLGYVYLVTNQGTLALGRTTFSNAVWEASKSKPEAISA